METLLSSSIDSEGIRKALLFDVEQVNNRITNIDITVEFSPTPFCKKKFEEKCNPINLTYKEAKALWFGLSKVLKPTISPKNNTKK